MTVFLGLACAGIGLLIAVIAVVYSVSSAASGGNTAQKAAEWVAMGSRLGFQGRGDEFSGVMGGVWNGHAAEIRVFRDLHRSSFEQPTERKAWTHFVVYWPRRAQLGLSVSQLGHATRLLDITRARKRIQIGDPTFDRAVVVKGHDPAAVAAFLTPTMRAEILRVVAKNDYVEINDAGAAVALHQWCTNQEEVVAWLNDLARVVQVAVDAHGR